MSADAGRRYRAYPDPAQATRLTGWGHTCRAVWNIALEQRQYVWTQRRRTLRAVEQCAHLTAGRAELPWLADLPAQCGQQVLRDIDRAYDNWWNPRHPAQAPTRKKRDDNRVSIPFPGQAVRVEKLNARWARVRLPKIGWVRFRLSRPLGGTVRNATVSMDPLGWHVSFGVASDTPPAVPNGRPGCGVDFGVTVSAYVSDETTPRMMAPTLKPGEQSRLLHLERTKARQIGWAKKYNSGRYSNRLRRTVGKIAAVKARQARRRLDFMHKLTTDLTKNHGWVAIEDLNVQGMTRSANGTVESPGSRVRQKAGLNRGILDNTPGERRRQLEYKAVRFGSQVRPVWAAYTSQTCAQCGLVDPKSRPGCGREFECVHCGHADHADRNAAVNIMMRAEGQPAVKYAQSPLVARPREASRMRAALVSA